MSGFVCGFVRAMEGRWRGGSCTCGFVRVRACVCVRARACVRACVRVCEMCVRAWVRECVRVCFVRTCVCV